MNSLEWRTEKNTKQSYLMCRPSYNQPHLRRIGADSCVQHLICCDIGNSYIWRIVAWVLLGGLKFGVCWVCCLQVNVFTRQAFFVVNRRVVFVYIKRHASITSQVGGRSPALSSESFGRRLSGNRSKYERAWFPRAILVLLHFLCPLSQSLAKF